PPGRARGAVRLLGARRPPAAVVAEPGDAGPRADVDGPRPPRPADGPVADQDRGDRAGARAGLAERPAPGPAPGPAGGLAAGPDSPDRLAGRTPHRSVRTPRGARLNPPRPVTRRRPPGGQGDAPRPNP